MLLGSTWGVLWLGRLAVLGLALACLLVSVRRAGPARSARPSTSSRAHPTRLAVAALVVACAVDGWAGHASTLPARSPLAALAAAVHVLAAGVWAGALLVLVVTVVPLMRMDARTRRTVSPAAWRAFSPMAATSTVALVATGVYESGRHVESLGDLTRSAYGAAVVAKAVLVAVALGLAAYNTVLVNPGVADRVGRALRRGPGWRPRRRRLSTTVVVEALVLSVAVAVAALMTSVPTAREVRAAQAVTAPHSETIDGLFVTFEAVPLGSQLRLVVRTEAVVRPQPAPPTGVEVGLAEGTTSTLTTTAGHRVVLTQVEPGRWEGQASEPRATDWTGEVVVHRANRPDAAVLVPWSSTPTDTVTPLELVTGGLAALMLLGLLTVLRDRRRRTEASRRLTSDRPQSDPAPERTSGSAAGSTPGFPPDPDPAPDDPAPATHRSPEGASSR